MKNNIAIKLTNVSKKYTLHHEKPTLVGNVLGKKEKEEFWALKDINLEIKKGEKVGIIGPNGSGKTTLLEIIAGITAPTTGAVETKGKLVSLIELEAGFHPELTGEENVYLNGLLLGMSKDEVKKCFKKIFDFADIGKFVDSPLYTYSEGMKLRLGFSVAVHAEPDVLILDEVIAAGDEEFREKSGKKIEEFFKANKTIIVVTHWLDFLKKNTDRLMWISDSVIFRDSTSKSRLIADYSKSSGAE